MAITVIRFEPYKEEDIEQYIERLEILLTVNAMDEEKKVGHVLSGIEATAYLVLRNLLAPTNPKDSGLTTIKQKLLQHYKPKPPVIGQQFIFHQQIQKPGEPINQFLIELCRLVHACKFGQFLEEALHDRLARP